MKVTIEFEEKDVAEQAIKAIVNEAYKWELKREHFKEQYEEVQLLNIDEMRKKHRLEYNARRGAECKLMSDRLWDTAEAIRSQIRNKD